MVEESPNSSSIMSAAQTGFDILVKRMGEGDNFKQAVADALAGPSLDVIAANSQIDSIVQSSPCVVFSWTMSPFSKKAKQILDQIGAQYKVVELNEPWKDGNMLRAALGRRVGRTSVPAVFIGGNYIGGCDDGPSPECPGLMKLAIQGKLRPLLIESGALAVDDLVDFAPPFARRILASSLSSAKENTRASTHPTSAAPSTHPVVVSAGSTDEGDDECPSDGQCEVPE
jgi:glutaredoxin